MWRYQHSTHNLHGYKQLGGGGGGNKASDGWRHPCCNASTTPFFVEEKSGEVGHKNQFGVLMNSGIKVRGCRKTKWRYRKKNGPVVDNGSCKPKMMQQSESESKKG